VPRAWCYGDDVDTDAIIPARYLTSTDERELGLHALEASVTATSSSQGRTSDVVRAVSTHPLR
jgi:3-isopropylmalate/(R)-2-methylmalate dehydratase small subunit